MNPKDCKYTKGHTWVRVSGQEATVGVSDYAQKQLGSVLFVEVAQVGDAVAQGKPCGTIESDKATSEVQSPVSGKVTAVNQDTLDAPESVNKDPYGKGWLLKVQMSNPGELQSLMTAEAFEKYISGP